jgi:hypothetical protein
MLTLGNWIFIGFCLIVGIIISIFIWLSEESITGAIINFLVAIIVCILVGIGLNWYNTSTASGIRAYKDFQSELANGIEREITITAEDGREIFHYEGKVDVESNHEDNYIKFESEEGKRYIIYYGIQDTITIIEK